MKATRTIAGFALAPIVGVTCVSPILAFENESQYFSFLKLALLTFMFGLPIAYVVSSVFGIPVFFLMRRRGWTRIWQSTVAGGLLGSIALGSFIALVMPDGQVLRSFAVGFPFGAVAGAVFWRIVFRDDQSSTITAS